MRGPGLTAAAAIVLLSGVAVALISRATGDAGPSVAANAPAWAVEPIAVAHPADAPIEAPAAAEPAAPQSGEALAAAAPAPTPAAEPGSPRPSRATLRQQRRQEMAARRAREAEDRGTEALAPQEDRGALKAAGIDSRALQTMIDGRVPRDLIQDGATGEEAR